MTRQGAFKRHVRQHARDTGQRYTEALAAIELSRKQPFAHTRQFDPDSLREHLEARYGILISSLLPIDDDPDDRPRGSWPGHYPWTLLVKRSDGPPWIARVFSSTADQVHRVHGDAEILRFLAAHHYPAERIAHEEPVSIFDGSGVIVTEYVAGNRPISSPAVYGELGRLLGHLHALPDAGGAMARDGGAEEHDGGFFVGRPKRDLVAAMSFLVDVEDAVPVDAREGFETLRDLVERADDAESLPEALTHSNFHPWAAVGQPGNLTIVGWAGSGQGARLPALAWLLTTVAEADPDQIGSVLRGYREHIQLTDDEIERLPGVLNMRPLWLACLMYREVVRSGRVPDMNDSWIGWRQERADHIASLAISALRT